MKCIVIETSPERINAKPVTNENGTPHVYATISEARAELKSNGYSYNRANRRYYINGTEYRAYILRADSEEYAEIMEQAECNPTDDAQRAEIITAAAYSLINAYADAIGEYPAETDPEYMAAFAVAGEEIAGWHGVADIHDRATVTAMVEAIAARWTQDHQPEDESEWIETGANTAVFIEDGYIKRGTAQGPQGIKTTYPYTSYDAHTWTSAGRATLADLRAGLVVMM